MATQLAQSSPERLLSLGRAAIEARRFASPQHERLDTSWNEATSRLAKEQRAAARDLLEPLIAGAAPRKRQSFATADDAPSDVQQIVQQRARLELELQKSADRISQVEQSLSTEKSEHQHAIESLSLQQRKLKEFQAERAQLLASVSELESQLRKQINETEQVELQRQRLKGSRQDMNEQATKLTERINALEAENAKLQQELEASRKGRDSDVAGVEQALETAEGETEDAALKHLWARLGEQNAAVFVQTHVPTRQTFERLGDALVEFARAFKVIELHVHHFLKDLRQVGVQADRLNTFYMMLTRKPGVLENLSDYVTSGRGKGNFTNLLRAEQVWARAFTTGLYKTIVQLPNLLADELNPRNWDVRTDKDAVLAKHFREVIRQQVPEKLGTEARRRAGEMAYQDYNDLFKRR